MSTRPRVAERLRTQYRRHVSLLPLLGLIPSFLLAAYSLTEPWARARVMFVWGISKSPDAALLVVVTLAGMVAASVAVAARGGRHAAAAAVHLATGALMLGVAWAAYSMIRHAGVRLLGFLPIADVRPGRGLVHFVIAALLVLALGALEASIARSRRRVREPSSPS